jgi:hypothetical protein
MLDRRSFRFALAGVGALLLVSEACGGEIVSDETPNGGASDDPPPRGESLLLVSPDRRAA